MVALLQGLAVVDGQVAGRADFSMHVLVVLHQLAVQLGAKLALVALVVAVLGRLVALQLEPGLGAEAAQVAEDLLDQLGMLLTLVAPAVNDWLLH